MRSCWAQSFVLLACLAVNGRSDPRTQEKNTVPAFRTGVSLVVVPVVVLDRHGHAIGDLQREDFRIFDRGKLQSLASFSAQTRVAEERQEIGTDSSAPAESSRSTPSRAATRFVLLLFDDLHLSAGELAAVRKAAGLVLDRTGDQFAVAAVISTSTRTNTGFTQDRTRLRKPSRI